MIRQESQALQHVSSHQDTDHVAAQLAVSGGYGTLILDRLGRIVSCGVAATTIFGDGQTGLAGRQISEFIAGLFLTGTSPSYCGPHLGYLCADDDWRRFEAKDVTGRRFVVHAMLSRMSFDGEVDGEELVLLTVHRPDVAL